MFLPHNTRELTVLPVPSLCSAWQSFCEQTEILWVQPLALGEQEPHIVVYPLAGVEVTGGGTSLPAKNLLSVVTHRPFCQHLLHARWNIIWVRPGGATFLLQLPFPVTRGCFQGIEQAAKDSYCSLCWHCHSASSCSTAWGNGDSAGYFPATNSCMFPSWEAGLVLGRWSDAMKFKERPEAKLQNWEEGIIAGRGTAGKTIERKMAIRKKEMIGNWRRVGLTEREWRKTLWEEWFDHFVGNTGYLNQDFKFIYFFFIIPALICELLQKNSFIVVCLTFPIYEAGITAISNPTAGEGILRS